MPNILQKKFKRQNRTARNSAARASKQLDFAGNRLLARAAQGAYPPFDFS